LSAAQLNSRRRRRRRRIRERTAQAGLVPEPHALSHAVDFASEWLRTSTLARFDVAHSREGWELSFRLSDPFRLSRRSLRMTTIPFVP